MFYVILKICVLVACTYLAFDSFFKARKFRDEIQKKIVNPNLGKVFRRRALRAGVIYVLVALAALVTLVLGIEPPVGD